MHRKITLLILSIALIAGPITGFYWHYEQFSNALERNFHFNSEKANAVKHAYAAAQITILLQRLTTEPFAEEAVLFLGYTNERFEQVIDRFTADSTAEIAKDLHNNQAGITAALWHVQHPETSLRDTLIFLANAHVLIDKATDAHVVHDTIALKRQQAVTAAIAQFETDRAAILLQVKKALTAHAEIPRK